MLEALDTVSALITAVKAASLAPNCIVLPFRKVVIMVLKGTEPISHAEQMTTMVRGGRISFSTPPTLLKQFDDSLITLGYEDRSKALQIAMKNFITEYAWKREMFWHGTLFGLESL